MNKSKQKKSLEKFMLRERIFSVNWPKVIIMVSLLKRNASNKFMIKKKVYDLPIIKKTNANYLKMSEYPDFFPNFEHDLCQVSMPVKPSLLYLFPGSFQVKSLIYQNTNTSTDR
jgi:hypothetical protein